MVNKVILVGNLGRDPQVRSTPSGQPVADFTLATNRKWKDKNGQRQEQTEWHTVVCWGRQAEVGPFCRSVSPKSRVNAAAVSIPAEGVPSVHSRA